MLIRSVFRNCIVLALASVAGCIYAQLPTIAPNLARTEGIDSSSGIAYTRLYIGAQPTNATTAQFDLSQPTLTAQCTRQPSGKLRFELFVNFGGVTDPAFYPPWKPSPGDLYPPSTSKANLTMEFLGYTKVKPFKREWEYVINPSGQLRYNPPGSRSRNLEEISYFFQFLRALPTLRLIGEGHTVEFLTTDLQAQLHKEPLCQASGV